MSIPLPSFPGDHAHRVVLELATADLSRAWGDAVAACGKHRALAIAPVYCGDGDAQLRIESADEAARFILAIGSDAKAGGVGAIGLAISRAADRAGVRFGFRWRRRPDQSPPEEERNGRPGSPVVEVGGTRYPSVRLAAVAMAGKVDRAAELAIYRACRDGRPAFGRRWHRADEPNRWWARRDVPVAWRVTVNGAESVVTATTRGRAIGEAVAAAVDAGDPRYRGDYPMRFRTQAVRAPEHDIRIERKTA